MHLVDYFMSFKNATTNILEMDAREARETARKIARFIKTIEVFCASFEYMTPDEIASVRNTSVILFEAADVMDDENSQEEENETMGGTNDSNDAHECFLARTEREMRLHQFERLGGNLETVDAAPTLERLRWECDCLQQAIGNIAAIHPMNRAVACARPRVDERIEEKHSEDLDYIFRVSIIHGIFTVAEGFAAHMLGCSEFSDIKAVPADVIGLRTSMLKAFREFKMNLTASAARDLAGDLAKRAAHFIEESSRYMERAWFKHGGGLRSPVSEAWTILDVLEHDAREFAEEGGQPAFILTPAEALVVRDRCLTRFVEDLQIPVSTDNVVKYALDVVVQSLRQSAPDAGVPYVYQRFGVVAANELDGDLEAEQQEAEQLEAEQLEAEQLEAEQQEAEQLEAEQLEAELEEGEVEIVGSLDESSGNESHGSPESHDGIDPPCAKRRRSSADGICFVTTKCELLALVACP